MQRSLALKAVVCLTTLAPATSLYAAVDPQVEALKQELTELKRRYEAQQQALMVLEQRVRQVEETPAAPPPKRLVRSPSERVKGARPSLPGRLGPPAPRMGRRWPRTPSLRRASPTCTTRPAGSSGVASSASKPA